MHRFLVSSLLLVVCVGSACGQAKFSAIHGASAAKYQEWVNGLDKQNLRPTFVSGADVKGEPTFAAVALENTDRQAWQARHHRTAEEYQKDFVALRDKGLRPICISGYMRGDVVNYAALFVKDDPGMWQARSGQTGDQSQGTIEQLLKDGYRPLQIIGYPAGAGVQFASLYVKSDGRNWRARTNITAEEYQKVFDEFAAKNARPISVTAYPTKDGTRFGIILAENKEKLAWRAKHHLTPKQYQEFFDEMVSNGFRPTHVCAYPWEGDIRYVGIFTKEGK